MKKILYILFAFVLSACSNDDISDSKVETDEIEKTITICVPKLDPSSRALGETADITNLTLLVFDGNGYFLYKENAQLLSDTNEEVAEHKNVAINTTKFFQVKLKVTSSHRIIHFIANYNFSTIDTPDLEQVLIANMTVSGDDDVYWQRVDYINGITETTNMNNIPMVRNFAKISVIDYANNFELTGYQLINKPTKGTIAAYSKGTFASYSEGTTYSNLINSGYEGSMPTELSFENLSDNTTNIVVDNLKPIYTYERTQPRDDTYTYLIIRGKYGNDQEDTYYKVDLIDNSSHRLHILRNFAYTVNINDVISSGKKTIAETVSNVANNNLNTSVLTENLLNISDGDTRLFVSFTDTVLVNTNPIYLKYKYISDIENNTINNNSVEKTNLSEGNVVSEYEDGTEFDSNNYYTIKITPKTPQVQTQKQTITIKGGKLVRDVNLYLIRPLTMTINCTESVDNTINASVNLEIKIPSGLSELYFPLEFRIEASNLSIYPDAEKDYLPIETGKTIIPNNTNNSFRYIKTIEYAEYYDSSNKNYNTDYTCYFKTNKTTSASTIYVSNKYFNIVSCSFVNKTQ